MNKVPLVLWSGGLDSTYIVWDELSRGNDIDIVYVNIENNTDKMKREHRAIDKLKVTLSEYDAKILREHKINIPTVQGNLHKEVCLSQAFFWSYGLQMAYDRFRHSKVQMGYIKGDDFWPVKSMFEKTIQSSGNAFFGGRDIQLEYPLEYKDKHFIYSHYNDSEYGKRLLNDITWCEEAGRVDGKWTANCTCIPCTKMRRVKLCHEHGI